jgi:SpoIID/LytB domain protein
MNLKKQISRSESRHKHASPISIMAVLVLLCVLWAISSHAQTPQKSPVSIAEVQVRLRYGAFKVPTAVRATAALLLTSESGKTRLGGGIWTFTASKVVPATRRFHVFPKTFPPSQEQELRAYMQSWKARGYAPEVLTFGRVFRTSAGKVMDNRLFWVSLARFKHQAEADALVKKLKTEEVYAWVRPETVAPGGATIEVADASGKTVYRGSTPMELHSEIPLELADVKTGFMKDRRADRTVAPPLRLRVGPDGSIEVMGELPLESYLKGVLPAEMPASWPMEALKAQAVAARSEILAGLAGKFELEGFDSTTLESCRAYAGLAGHTPATNRAVEETTGVALVHAGKVATTVFCACCGGWTEDNEKVWSGPANPVLRGVPDFPPGKNPAKSGLQAYGMQRWLTASPPAWCSGHKNFRWKKKLTKQQLSEIMRKSYNIGDVKAVRPGGRGVGGRLLSLEFVGTRGVAKVDRELAIRQVIGGLPSAMIIISSESAKSGLASLTLYGGGSGHGVGLCQQGAKAMAASGLAHAAILKHYFTGVELERFGS